MKTIDTLIDSYKDSGYTEIENAYTYNQVEDMIYEYAKEMLVLVEQKLIAREPISYGQIDGIMDELKAEIR